MPTPIPYVNPSWAEQAQGVTQSGGTGGAVPSSASPSDKQSANPVLDSLGAAMKQANDAVAKAAATVNSTPAYTSSSSGGSPTMPVSKGGPLPNASVNNVANQKPETRAGARNKAVGQIAAQAGSIINNFMKKKEEQKTQQLGMDLHRTMELTQGMDEAKQLLASDPNNAQAKAQLQKNQALLNNLLSDPKKAKAIAKAYDVTFGEGAKEQAGKDKSKNAQEKQAMQGAMRAQQLQDQTPSRMEANPAHIQAQTQLAATQKQAQELLKTYTTMADSVMKDQTTRDVAADNNQRARDVETTRAGSAERIEQMRANTSTENNRQNHLARMSEIGAEGANRMKEIKATKDSNMQQEGAKAWLGDITSGVKDINDQITKVDIELNKPENKQDSNTDASKRLLEQKNQLVEQRNALNTQHDQALMFMFNDPNAAAMMSLTQGIKDK